MTQSESTSREACAMQKDSTHTHRICIAPLININHAVTDLRPPPHQDHQGPHVQRSRSRDLLGRARDQTVPYLGGRVGVSLLSMFPRETKRSKVEAVRHLQSDM